jgi:hypothetical protein
MIYDSSKIIYSSRYCFKSQIINDMSVAKNIISIFGDFLPNPPYKNEDSFERYLIQLKKTAEKS